MVFLYHLRVGFLHLRVVFTTTSVWVISTFVWLHLYPRTMGPSVATHFEQFLVDLWVSPTLFMGLLFFKWVSFTDCGVAGRLVGLPNPVRGFPFLPVGLFYSLRVDGHYDCGFSEFSSSWWFFSVTIYAGLLWGFGIISNFDLEKLIRLDIVVL